MPIYVEKYVTAEICENAAVAYLHKTDMPSMYIML